MTLEGELLQDTVSADGVPSACHGDGRLCVDDKRCTARQTDGVVSTAYTAPPRLCPTKTPMDSTRNHPTQRTYAAGRLADDGPPLQSAVNCQTRHDGE